LEVQVVPPVAVNNFYNLLRVGPVHVLPADTEFPASFAQLDLFARFFDGIGVWDFEVQTLWVDAPGKGSEVALLGPQRIHFRAGEPVRDYNFRLSNLPLPGVGRYQFQLWILGRRRRRLIAIEFLEVTKQP